MSAAGRKCGRLTAVVKMRRPDVRDFIEASKALVTMAGKIDQMQARVSLKSVA